MRNPLPFLALLALAPWASVAGETRAPPFFAYCVEMGAPGVKARPLAEQAAWLRNLGYAGMGCDVGLGPALDQNLRVLDDAGLALAMVWTTINVNPAQPAFDPRLPEAIRKLTGRTTIVSVLLTGFPPGDLQGMAPAVSILRQLGDMAAEARLRISIYNHVGNWTESLPFIVEVVKKTDHPQVGFNFNLCHWLKVSGGGDWRPLLRDNAGKLFVVTLNGATAGAKDWTHGLIRPLDEGDFDNGQLLATLRDIGYRGPIGLMCYGVPGDARAHLARSMTAWRKLGQGAAE